MPHHMAARSVLYLLNNGDLTTDEMPLAAKAMRETLTRMAGEPAPKKASHRLTLIQPTA